MRPDSKLPIPDDQFDVICLFSVFTHLNPIDFRNMLQVLRPYVKSSGRCFFTLYIDELTDGGFGLIDGHARVFGAAIAAQTVDYRDFTAGIRSVPRCTRSATHAS
jgi:SAM-dependent methyltransferase